MAEKQHKTPLYSSLRAIKRTILSVTNAVMSTNTSSSERQGRRALEKMGLESEFVTIPRELFNAYRKSHSLLQKGLKHLDASAKWIQLAQKEELRTLVDAWTPEARHEHFRVCLDNAENSLFRIDGKEVFVWPNPLSHL